LFALPPCLYFAPRPPLDNTPLPNAIYLLYYAFETSPIPLDPPTHPANTTAQTPLGDFLGGSLFQTLMINCTLSPPFFHLLWFQVFRSDLLQRLLVEQIYFIDVVSPTTLCPSLSFSSPALPLSLLFPITVTIFSSQNLPPSLPQFPFPPNGGNYGLFFSREGIFLNLPFFPGGDLTPLFPVLPKSSLAGLKDALPPYPFSLLPRYLY